MRCDRCGDERPLEDFDLGLMRAPLHSHELQALDRLRREPAQICRDCFRPSPAASLVDGLLAPADTSDVDPTLDLLADVVDWFRRRMGRSGA